MKKGIYARFIISEWNLRPEIVKAKADFAATSVFFSLPLIPTWQGSQQNAMLLT